MNRLAPPCRASRALIFACLIGLAAGVACGEASQPATAIPSPGATPARILSTTQPPLPEVNGDAPQGDPIDVAQFGSKRGNASICDDVIRLGVAMAEPGWLLDPLDDEGAMEPPASPLSTSRWCGCGLDSSDGQITLTSPGGVKTDITLDSDLTGAGCVDSSLRQPGFIPRPGSTIVRLVADGKTVLFTRFDLVYRKVNVKSGPDDLFYSGGFQPGESVRVVYFVADGQANFLPDALFESLDLFPQAHTYRRAADITASADADGMVVVQTDASRQQGIIVAMRGDSGWDFYCEDAGLPGCSPLAFSVPGGFEPRYTTEQILFDAAPGRVGDVLPLDEIQAASASNEPVTCPGFVVSRLTIDQPGYVTPGLPNRVRELPGFSADILGQIPSEAGFSVLAGPVCADDTAWWKVNYEGLVGWTAEGQSATYWLEP